jgi:hypothetical protein
MQEKKEKPVHEDMSQELSQYDDEHHRVLSVHPYHPNQASSRIEKGQDEYDQVSHYDNDSILSKQKQCSQ